MRGKFISGIPSKKISISKGHNKHLHDVELPVLKAKAKIQNPVLGCIIGGNPFFFAYPI